MFYVLMGVLAFAGVYAIYLFYYLVYGGVWTAYLLIRNRCKKEVKKEVREETTLSPSSIPAMLGASDSVFDYVAKLHNEDKKLAYSLILTDIRAVVLEVARHPDMYPNGIEFCIMQLRALIKKSSVGNCMETAKFRDLCSMFIANEWCRLSKGEGI